MLFSPETGIRPKFIAREIIFVWKGIDGETMIPWIFPFHYATNNLRRVWRCTYVCIFTYLHSRLEKFRSAGSSTTQTKNNNSCELHSRRQLCAPAERSIRVYVLYTPQCGHIGHRDSSWTLAEKQNQNVVCAKPRSLETKNPICIYTRLPRGKIEKYAEIAGCHYW